MNSAQRSRLRARELPLLRQAQSAWIRHLRSLLNPNDPRHLLVNRATQGVYPPVRRLPIVAEAALASGLISLY
jgi:hypothetical protein